MEGTEGKMGLKMAEKKAISAEISKRYQKAGKKQKGKILDEFCQTTGYNRKYALHLLANWGKTQVVSVSGKPVKLKATAKKRRKGGGRKPVYGPELIAVLRVIWAFFGSMCGKLLAPLLRQQMAFFEGWEPFHITPAIKKKLLAISPASIDRKLRAEKNKLRPKGRCCTKPGRLLKSQIPIRVYYPWSDRKPGFFEIDTVHHCGISEAGEFCLTLDATDVYSGWVELRALRNKAHKWVLEELTHIREQLPFALLGIDSDGGEEFINYALVRWAAEAHVQFTRSRPYHKNDNCFVEQKNDKCVRDRVGYNRFDTQAEQEALAQVYRLLCPLLNYFLPTSKLISKTRVGSKIKKVYDPPLSPYQRLLAHPELPEKVKQELRRRYKLYNPVVLQQQVHSALNALESVYAQKSLPASAHT